MLMSSTLARSNSPLRFRPIEAADEALLLAIYASTRAEEMALVSHWTAEQREGFLTQQFQAQHQYYQQYYQGATFEVILCGDRPAGRLYLHRREKEIRIVDIAFLPEFRYQGFGGQILRHLQQEAAAAGKALTIHVERQNPALKWYEKLGFQPIKTDNPVYLLMSWQAPA